ncbi:MAG: alpha-hydroxy acid oxidase [Pseudomonadota bacterium]|nr:alpha-hydroxy acid oxidase [Pseudomonadota bacterium]MEC8642475.1 alpha-hydroxy acid oxidase [Pseudomonadota bacterium]
MSDMLKYPRLTDLEKKAKRRIPPFMFAYLDAGTGRDFAKDANEAAYREISLTPQFLRGRVAADTSTTLLGKVYGAPFGVAPIGLSSTIWPGAEQILARAAKAHNFPYALSTVAGDSIERVSKVGGDITWFQLYPPADRDMCLDMMRRARECGVDTLVVTADVPAPSRRERMRLSGGPVGSRGKSMYTPRVIMQSMSRPEWALRLLANGGPRFRNIEPYSDRFGGMGVTEFIGSQLNGGLDWDYLDIIRDRWPGKLLLKGILHGQDAERAARAGVDGLVISNHGGRQLDAAPHPLHQLPHIRAVVGNKMPLIVDSGIRSGLDVAKAIASGADFVLIGRSFLYAVAALGKRGGEHAATVLTEELQDVMRQLGVASIDGLSDVPVTRASSRTL